MSTLYTKEGIKKVCKTALYQFIADRLAPHGTLLYAAVTGSHLYGCSHAESDFDIKGVFLPHKDMVLNYEHPKSINAKMETGPDHPDMEGVFHEGFPIDIEVWSLQWFHRCLSKGDSNSLDLLFSKSYPDMILVEDENFFGKHFTQENIEKKILFNKMTGLSGYCYRQAEKYGVKGSRLNDLLKFRDEFLGVLSELEIDPSDSTQTDGFRLNEIWQNFDLDAYPHIKMVQLNKNRTEEEGISILGRIAPHYLRLTQTLEMMDRISGEFGKRTMNALDGTDWKAMSHAYRAGYEYLSLMNSKKIKFPLACGPKLLKIKKGEIFIDQVKEEIADMLEEIGTLDGTMFDRKKPSYNFLKGIVLDYYDD